MTQQALNQNLIERVAVGDLLRRSSRSSGEHTALVDFPGGQRRTLSYRQLNQRVNQLARGLMAKGLQQGDKLALVSSNNSDMLVVYFACYKLGVVAVPINFLQGADDIRYNLEHSGTRAVVYENILANIIRPCMQGNDTIAFSAQIGSEPGAADYSLDELIAGQDSSELEDRIIRDRDTAHMIYTSGTTSRPKAVETSHLALVMAAMGAALELDIRKHSSVLLVLPLFHCAALSQTLPALLRASKVVLHAA
ncbi:MAG: AMP-binding protein, partial [Cellvibrionaceae bacterium]|nr:AMP-binding protein [Cellvibrionaceae bacterium]